MDIKEIRERARLTDYKIYFRGYSIHISDSVKKHIFDDIVKDQQDRDFNLPMVPERECGECDGEGISGGLAGCLMGLIHLEDCSKCRGTGKLAKVTIKDILEGYNG